MSSKRLTIAVDFDGTMVKHDYPNIGEEIGAVEVLLKLQELGHKIILFTMRSGTELHEARLWCREQGINLYGVNENPSQHTWTTSHKPYAHVYIDDAALGCPLIHPEDGSRPYVDWNKVKEYFCL